MWGAAKRKEVSKSALLEWGKNDGKVVGGIYDDRFLVKPTKSAVEMMPDANSELPYEGAKEMLLVDDVEDKVFLRELIETMYNELK